MKKTYYAPQAEVLELGLGSSLLNNGSLNGDTSSPDMPIEDPGDVWDVMQF